ncbi:MAG TPA: sigma-70 family RNA polymerase sigma factor [Chthoniobacterales bacterium]|nr:sigma-70 family RNA polymerase sigma factor [Chthoniobacterales bacterium]
MIEIWPQLQAYCRRRVGDTATAEDLAQEILLKAFRGRAALRDETRLVAWLYRIAHGTVMDHYRRKPRPETWLCEPAQASRPNDITAVMTSNVRCYLETLPRGYRDAVHLADYEGLPHAEVARRLGFSLAAAKSRVLRGRLMVKRLMEARCRFEYDRLGNVIGYQLRSAGCSGEAA